MEQNTLSKWLKVIIIGVGICGIIVFLGILPMLGNAFRTEYPEFANRFWPWLIFIWVCALPCYAVLILGWKIATNIGRDRSFITENSKYLKWISWLAAGDAAFVFIVDIIFLVANLSHPSVFLGLLIVVFVGVAISVAAAALSHLVNKAAVLQEQSDLTI